MSKLIYTKRNVIETKVLLNVLLAVLLNEKSSNTSRSNKQYNIVRG